MDKTRLWIIGSVLAMVVVGVLGWVVGIQPQLDQAAAADAQTAQVDSANSANAAVLARLKKDSEQLPALTDRLAALAASVPAERQGDEFTAEAAALAASTGVTVIGTEISDGQAYAAPADPGAGSGGAAATGSAGGSASSGSSSTPTPTPSGSATPAPAGTAQPTPGMPPAPNPLITGKDFAVVPFTVTVTGDYAQVLAYIDALQHASRLALVDSVDVGPAASASGYDAKLGGYLYVLRGAQPAANGG